MIKKIVFAVLVFISGQLFSQENTASPYSFYGIGDAKFKGTNDIIAIGGLSVYSDSTHLNVLNPASYANQMLTSIQVGGTSNFYKLSSSTDTQKAQKTTFDYLVIGLPYSKKLGFSLGLLPQSAVGYRLVNDQLSTNNYAYRYNGSGGLNKVYFGAGYQLTSKLSVGMDFQYLFGSIDAKTTLLISNVQFSTREINNSNVTGVGLNFGLNYQSKLNDKINYRTSFTFAPEMKLNSKNSRQIATISFGADGTEIPASVNDIDVADTKLVLPTKIAAGFGLGNRKWFVGADYTFRGTGNQVNRFENYSNVSYENSSKIAIGGFFIPKYDSYKNYFERVTYRAGFRYENTGLVINNTSIKDRALSFGFAFPITGTFSSLSIGSEWGTRGTSANGLIKENYFSVNVGLIFNDKWFKKNLYN
ncbi:Protein of unknown function precursor, putative outer membrane protein [Flavobacterium indicum GPTSA100-9 = DSM 17447]|uniref:Outer membrane protein n=1 Tax=Flavobacterium indicum (strain DSM 17447 / CIP 109464 / GPTSA100-9) TaxID=1094466 RepID=H8XRB9_FLAIG|nr:hypothetical protein [Flavobacterium indicum]CCG54353.1 Protein of unknown function precursor, putative outer membrane protein [Flavobacterium indicum GPTSA100-9 = DSM 17447]